MPIGYIGNLATLQQGNEFAAQQLAGLGQQIGQAINLHAQTQAAQAMLPALQSQVQQGMQKIASGHSEGLSDVYGAATSASQIPLLAPMASHAVNMANMANVQAQHLLRTDIYQQGRMASLLAKNPGLFDPQTGAINLNYTPPAKQVDPVKRLSDLNKLRDQFSKQMQNAVAAQNANAYNSAAQNFAQVSQEIGRVSGNPQQLPMKFQQAQNAHAMIDALGQSPDPAKLSEVQNQVRQIASDPNNLALTSDQQELLNKAQKAYQKTKNLPEIQKVLQKNGISPNLLNFKSQQPSQQSSNPSQSTSMIPAATSGMYAQSPESADEQEAVEGGEGEETEQEPDETASTA
jgi:hypothetical protein